MEYYSNDLVTLYHGDCTGELLPLLDYVPEDWVVCDPFAGSGAVLRACQNRGRRCVGIELVGEYCELAKSLLIDPKEFL